jgi:D-alanyl-D-alanine carboxypeptidase
MIGLIARAAAAVALLILVVFGGQVAWRAWTGPSLLSAAAAPLALRAAPRDPARPCEQARGFEAAAADDAQSLTTAAWSVFGRAESGWEVYAPLVAQEIGSACAPGSTGFARDLAAWQGAHALPATGVMDAASLTAMNHTWLSRRPFVAATMHGVCPDPPGPERLAWTRPEESYSSKPVQLRGTALDAYRAMVAAARREVPEAAGDPRLLSLFSAYREPVADAARCAEAGDCGTIAKANCSAHRTGLAADLYLGAAPGFRPDSAADPNRAWMSRTATYRWMVANAGRFGFVNYPFEPWHWEWTGEPI